MRKVDEAHIRYGFYIEKTSKKIKQTLQRKFNTLDSGITVDQWVILNTLYTEKGLNQYEIASKTYKDAPTVTRIIDLLTKKGLVKRVIDENDRRRFKIFLTDQGLSKVKKLLPMVIKIQKQGWGDMGQEDYQILMGILDKIFLNMDT